VALIVAAGAGTRLGAARPKQYLPLAGRPLLRWAVDAFLGHPGIGRIQLVIGADQQDECRAALAGLDLPPPVIGGATRQESVRLGLEALAAGAPETVLIHDAARPLLDRGTIDRVLAGLAGADGAVAALPLADTLRRGDGTLVPREDLWRAQTPQGFRFGAILAAHRAEAGGSWTDDAAVAAAAGLSVIMVPGDPANFKVTDMNDLAFAERLAAALTHLPDIRTGTGFDVHVFGEGDHLMLCGVRVPHSRGVVAHSDGDVGLHALTDAILGTIGAGDIGQHFPPSEARWKGAASDRFLLHAAEMVTARGGRIAHVDITILCEAPKVGPHRAAMTARIGELLGLSADRVSVKATTTERLGFTGRGEGIAAQAVATVRLPA
jgi:2-C-methyl-D-erythritol 4-phosphate cytidylyltransferase/2-C-methyl-D-erythritol 2,4-cyclodiphosphate synthase